MLSGAAALGCADPDTGRVSATMPGEPATVDDESWEATLTESCVVLGEQHAELATAVPDDAEGAQRHAAAVATFTEAYAEAFEAVDDPEGDIAAGRTVRQLAARLADAGRALDEAARAGDAEAAERSVQRLGRLGAALDSALDAWDVEACRGFGELDVTTP